MNAFTDVRLCSSGNSFPHGGKDERLNLIGEAALELVLRLCHFEWQ